MRGEEGRRENERNSWGTRDGAPPRKHMGIFSTVCVLRACISLDEARHPRIQTRTRSLYIAKQSADLCAKGCTRDSAMVRVHTSAICRYSSVLMNPGRAVNSRCSRDGVRALCGLRIAGSPPILQLENSAFSGWKPTLPQ